MKYIQLLWALLSFQEHLEFEPARLAAHEGHRIYSEMSTGNWWWYTQYRLPTGATIVPVKRASDKTHLANLSGDQHTWPLYPTIGNIRKDIRRTPQQCASILSGLIHSAPKGAKYIDEAWHSTVGTVMSQLRHIDITGPGLKLDSADGLQRQHYPLLAAWFGDYPEHVMVAQVSYGSGLMCEILQGSLMGHSTFWLLNNSRDRHIYPELLEDNYLDAQHTVGVHPIRNQFWQYFLCNVYCIWQPDELHELLLGSVKDWLHRLLKYLKDSNVEDQFDSRFTSVPQYPGLQYLSKPCHSLKSGTWQGKEIRGMIRILSVNCAPILDCSKDDSKTVAENAFYEKVMGAVQAVCKFSLLVSQQNDSDLSLKVLFAQLNRFYQKKSIFPEHKVLKSAKAKVDDLLATESHQLHEQRIHKIRATMEALLHGAEKVSSTKCRQF